MIVKGIGRQQQELTKCVDLANCGFNTQCVVRFDNEECIKSMGDASKSKVVVWVHLQFTLLSEAKGLSQTEVFSLPFSIVNRC